MSRSHANDEPPSYPNVEQTSFRQLDVREGLSIFFRRRRLGAVIVLVTLGGVFVGNYLTYPVYRSTVKILVDRATGADIPFSHEQIAFKKAEITQTQCELLGSTGVLEETVRALQLDTRPLPAATVRDRVHALGRRILAWYDEVKVSAKRWVYAELFGKAFEPPAPPDPFRNTVESLAGTIGVEPLVNTDLILLTVEDYEADVAERIANTMAESYLRRDVEAERERARQIYQMIDAQVKAFEPEYSRAEKELEDFERAHQARLLKERIQAKVREVSSFGVAHFEVSLTQEAKLVSLSMEVARLKQIYDPTHPKVVQAESELEAARARMTTGGTEASRPEGSVADVDTLLARNRASEEELGRLNDLDAEYARLLSQRDQQEKIYVYLKQKREEALIAQATRSAGTRVVDAAVAGLRPVLPRKTLNLILGLVGGLVLAAAACALIEFVDRSVKTPADVMRAAGVEVIGSIPNWRRGWLSVGRR